MSSLSKLTITVLICLLAVLAVLGQFVHVRQAVTRQGDYTSNSGQIVTGVLVGQTFVAEQNNLSAVALQFATYSNRKNTKPVEFHLRDSTTSITDLRAVTVDAATLNDNQMHRFDFAPIADSAGKLYFFFVTSPQSKPGDAVTVDINTQDPYFRGSAYIARTASGPMPDVALLNASGKPTVDLTFETYQTVLLREAVVSQSRSAIRDFIGGWAQNKGLYYVYLRAAIQALVVLGVVFMTTKARWANLTAGRSKFQVTAIILTLLFIAALVTRMMYAVSLPITDDEGNYLYDAQTMLHGHLAGGDGYVKAPLFIVWVAIWQFMMGHTVLAGRMSSVVISALTIFPLYILSKEFWGRRAALVSAALWACAGTAVVSGIYVHTQSVALFFAVSALAVLVMALRGTTPRLTFIGERTTPSAMPWFVFVGVLLGLGVASRKSVLALGLLPLLLIGIEDKTNKLRAKHVLAIGCGFLFVIAIFLGFAWLAYGPIGIQEAIGINSAEDSVAAVDPDQVDQIRAYSLHGMTPFFRESLPIIFAILLGLGFAGEEFLREVLQKISVGAKTAKEFLIRRIGPKLGWLLAWLVFAWAWNFFFNYEGQAFMFWGIPWLWDLFAIIGFVAMVVLPKHTQQNVSVAPSPAVSHSNQPNVVGEAESVFLNREQQKKDRPRRLASAWLIIPVWVGGLAFFYMNWIKFHANYISEFIPPLIAVAGYGFSKIWERFKINPFFAQDYPAWELLRRLILAVVMLVMFWALFVSNYITYLYEHTGTFDQQAVVRAAAWAKEHIPLNEPIFTGAAVVAYVSGHQVSLNIAHPRWYAYDFTRNNTGRLNTFLPSTQNMLQAFREAKFVLVDEQTKFSFFNEYDEINNSVKKDFIPVQSIDNGSNPLTFYQRIH